MTDTSSKYQKIKKFLLITVGVLALGLGILGIILPILPTTPFLLLAAACFMKSSDKLYQWVINHKVFGNYINNYIKYKAISFKSKVVAIISLWIMILSSAIFFVPIFKVKILLILIAIAVTAHILSIKTFKPEMLINETDN